MGWHEINWSLTAGIEFSIKTQNLILPVFDHATSALGEEWKKYEETFKKEIAAAYKRDESEGGIMSQEKDWEQDMHRQRLQAVGALALDWLMSSLQSALHSAKTYLDKTHPAKPPYDKSQGWLGSVTDEYKKRFNMDFTTGPVSFERIQELVLARNAGIHRESDGILTEYIKKIKAPVFVDYGNYGEHFFVTRDALVAMIGDTDRFIKWAVAEIEKLRPVPKTST
jgi:hypothetical protein